MQQMSEEDLSGMDSRQLSKTLRVALLPTNVCGRRMGVGNAVMQNSSTSTDTSNPNPFWSERKQSTSWLGRDLEDFH